MFSLSLLRQQLLRQKLLHRQLQTQLSAQQLKSQRGYHPSADRITQAWSPNPSIRIPFEISKNILPVPIQIFPWALYTQVGQNKAYPLDGIYGFKALIIKPEFIKPSYLTQEDMLRIEGSLAKDSKDFYDGQYVRHVKFAPGINHVVHFEVLSMKDNPKTQHPGHRIIWVSNSYISTNLDRDRFNENDLELFKKKMLEHCVNEPEGEFVATIELLNALSSSPFIVRQVERIEREQQNNNFMFLG